MLLQSILSSLFSHIKCLIFINVLFSFPSNKRKWVKRKRYMAYFKIHESWLLPKFQKDYIQVSSGKYYPMFLSLLKFLTQLDSRWYCAHISK